MPIKIEAAFNQGDSDLSNCPYIVAENLGLEVHLPADNELFVDIDEPEAMERLKHMRSVLAQNQIEVNVKAASSRKPGHKHVRVTLPFPVTPVERILLQAILGSDPKRELLSWLRIHFKLDRPPTVFFEEAA